jgi:hypothetical protein
MVNKFHMFFFAFCNGGSEEEIEPLYPFNGTFALECSQPMWLCHLGAYHGTSYKYCTVVQQTSLLSGWQSMIFRVPWSILVLGADYSEVFRISFFS